ncbi:hypothetical protein H9K57_08260 [Vibrio parahaemolyticus]|uniref:hypothetical protein n=1 Tax=Vibrio parahaemolyticus TaxID=670 RepID=UPI0020462F7D|nr:hypothetical protein [Vibrio parahaemolyticus]UPR37593.1 hypothetical protein H9K57_08260 [Vibrio parahaemolyticus]
MAVNRLVNEILTNPQILNKPIRDVLTQAELSLSLAELISSLPSSLPNPDTSLDEFSIEYMYRYIADHPKVLKVTAVKIRGEVVSLLIAEKTQGKKIYWRLSWGLFEKKPSSHINPRLEKS